MGRKCPLHPSSGTEGSCGDLSGGRVGSGSLWLPLEEYSGGVALIYGSNHVGARPCPLCPAGRPGDSLLGLSGGGVGGRGL